MKVFLLLITFFLFSFSGNVKKVYICGDHPCANKKEMNDYFDNNISVEVYTIDPSEETNKINLVKLNLNPLDQKGKKQDNNSLTLKKIDNIEKKIKERKKIAKLKIKKVQKEQKIKENIKKNKIVNKKKIKSNKSIKPTVAVVRICKNIQECDISEISKLIMDKGKNKPFPDISVQ